MASVPPENPAGIGERKCAACGVAKGIEAFSGKQWANKAHSRKCKDCIGGAGPASASGADTQKKNGPLGKEAVNKTTGKAKTKAKQEGKEEKGKEPVKPEKIDPARMLMRYEKLADTLQQHGASMCSFEEDDPFVCDVTGALIDMTIEGRYHFMDGRPPDDDHAICMTESAWETFDELPSLHPETWEQEYADKSKWQYIRPLPRHGDPPRPGDS